MLGALIDPTTKPVEPPTAPARAMHKTVVGGGFGFDPMTGAPNAEVMLPVAPPASSTIGLATSPMSTPAAPIPDAALAPVIQAPPVAAPTPAPMAPVATPVAAPVSAPVAAPVSAPVAPPAPVAVPRSREANRTMIGVGLNPFPAGAPAPVAAPPVAAAPAAPAAVPPPADAEPLDITSVDPPKAAPSGPAMPHRTMLGMPAPMVAAATAPAALAPAPTPAVAPAPAEPKRAIGPSNRTMLGVVAPAGRAASAAPPEPTAPTAPVYLPPTPQRSAEVSSTDVSIAGLPSPRRRVRGWLLALLALGVLLVASVIAAGLYYRMTRNRVEVAAVVAANASGEVLGVDVARAPAGAHVHFGTIDQPLTGTHVDFPLAADALHVGDNVVAIDVVFPDGSTESHSVTLTVEYRVRADLTTLSATPPAITVVVDALPTSTVVLDATPLALDAAGHGVRAYPIAAMTPDATGTLSLTAHYTITPPAPATPATGTLSSRVPTTVLRMERPADQAVTDRSTVDLSGVTQPGATVTVDGAAATVSADGHFSFSAPLASVGTHELHVAATMTGRAPASALIHVERVADLARAANAYTIDRTLTYARLAAAPGTFQGQHVAIEGRVYNVDLQDGHGVLQMLARDCPAGQRCPLWVTHSAVTDITVESWVRVIGSVAGEQQFMSQSGEVRTVPRVDAAFVLPSHP